MIGKPTMAEDYKVGYTRPPLHTRFAKGNRYGCRERKRPDAAEILKRVLNETIEYREGQKKERASKIKVLIKRLGSSALNGDIKAATLLLKMRLHLEKHGDVYPEILTIQVLESDLNL
jgi:hypothetical protein